MADDDKTQIIGPPDPVSVGTQLSGTYELDTRIASGGMGEVYRGHNIQTGDPVAIKIVLPEFARDATILSLFRKEASVLNHLFHEAIVRYHVFAIDQKIGRPYLAMEFVDGKSLAEMFAAGPMDPQDARKLLIRLASGLAVAHAAGVIHRDLSPDNIVLPDGRVDRAKIIDFGIARSATVGGETLLGGSFAGKYNFVSPEQLGMAGGEVTERSDIYSLGLVIAAALRGRTINMTGSQVEVIEKRRSVPDLSGIDAGMRPVLEAMLQPDPARRPASMAEIADGLRQAPPQPKNLWDTEPAPPRDTHPAAPATSAPSAATAAAAPPAAPVAGAAGPAPAPGEESWPPVTSRTPMPWKLPDDGTAPRAQPSSAASFGTTIAPPPAAPRRSGGLGLALVALLAVAGGGAGAYYGGLLDGFLKPGSVAPQPEPEPKPAGSETAPADAAPPASSQPAPPQPEPPPTQPDTPPQTPPSTGEPPLATDAPPPATDEPPAVMPPATNTPPETDAPPPATDAAPDMVPPTNVPPDTAPPAEPPVQQPVVPDPASQQPAPADTAPQPAPDTAVPAAPGDTVEPPLPGVSPRSAERQAWLKAYSGGECFFASSLPDVDDKMQIVGYGQSVAPFEALLEAFKATFATDPEPDIGVRLIAPKQCPATGLMRALEYASRPPPDLVMARDVLFVGDPLVGHVELQPGRETYLVLVDHDGIAHNLGGLLKKSADRAEFNVQLGLGSDTAIGKAPLPQVLLAISSAAPLAAMDEARSAPSAELLSRIEQELRAGGTDAAVAARYFRIRG